MADGSFTSVQFASLEAGEQAYQRAYAQLTETISTLETQLNTNLALWAGNARTAYQHAQAVWKSAEANMAAVMQSLGQVAGTAHNNYVTTEQVNANMWG